MLCCEFYLRYESYFLEPEGCFQPSEMAQLRLTAASSESQADFTLATTAKNKHMRLKTNSQYRQGLEHDPSFDFSPIAVIDLTLKKAYFA